MSTNTADQHEAAETGELIDTGDFLEVPEGQRLDHDDFVPNEVNADEFQTDFSHVPDGEEVELSTASLDED